MNNGRCIETIRKKKKNLKTYKQNNQCKSIDQISAGGVVYRKCSDEEIQVALIRDQNTQKWILPKGRIEEGESLEDTSLREIQEETGLHNIKLIEKIDKTNYWFVTQTKEKLTKEVHFFLYEDENGNDDMCVEKDNFDKGEWFSKEEAMNKISYPAQRKILFKAFEIIENGL